MTGNGADIGERQCAFDIVIAQELIVICGGGTHSLGCSVPDRNDQWPPGGPRRELGKHPTQELARAFVGMYVAMTGYRGELEGPSARMSVGDRRG